MFDANIYKIFCSEKLRVSASTSNYHPASIKLLLLRGWRMSIIPTRHERALPKLQFCTGNNSRRENHPIKARKESRPFNWILKTFQPGPARTYARSFILFNNLVASLLRPGFHTRWNIHRGEERRKNDSCARNLSVCSVDFGLWAV